jgi:two-component system, OmpR family, phosphate regulon response regulator OmpR
VSLEDIASRPHILVVDDDRRLRELLRKYLSDNGFLVTTAEDAAAAQGTMTGLSFDAAIVDVMMPGQSGLDLTRALRQSGHDLPILMLTAMGETADRITGLEAGADDYLAKPFEPRELVLRLQGLLRRRPAAVPDKPTTLRFGPWSWRIDRDDLVNGEGEERRLTTAEVALLRLLAGRLGEIVSRDEAASTGAGGSARAVDVQVVRLRRKLDDDGRLPRYLQTVRGEGYVLRAD